MARKIPNDVIIKEVENLGFEILDKDFKNTHSKVRFKCPVNEDHIWTTSIKAVLRSGNRCPHCSGKATIKGDALIERLAKNNPTLELLSSPELSLVKSHRFRCKICSYEFQQQNSRRTFSGENGCPSCGGTLPLTDDEVNSQLKVLGVELGQKYTRFNDYHYLKCLYCGEIWNAKLGNYLYKGYQCTCQVDTKQFRRSEETLLYYLRVTPPNLEKPLYKIGVTNNTVNKRYRSTDLKIIKVISEVMIPNGYEACEVESRILKTFSDYKYQGEPVLSSGNTELFTTDILGLDQ